MVASLLLAVDGAKAAAGGLDPSFGQGGRVIAGAGKFNAVALLDGRLVVAGTSGADVLVARFLPNGALDPSFGTDGVVTTDAGGQADEAHALVLTSGGRVTVVGTDGADFLLVRYQSDGELDPTFGQGGIVRSDVSKERQATAVAPEELGGGNADVATAVVALPDGRVVAGGRAGEISATDADSDLALARFSSDGSLDRTFGTAGVVFTEAGYQETITSMALMGNSYVVAGMGLLTNRQTTRDIILARYTDAGFLDPAFGPGGLVRTDLGADERGEDLAVGTDAKIVVAGQKGGDMAVVRYTGEGVLDKDFGPNGNGAVITNLGGHESAYAVALEQDKVLVAGTRSSDDVALVRYTGSGTADPTFGADGMVITDFGADLQTFDVARSLAVDTDGTAVVAGSSTPLGSSAGRAVLARYLTRDGESSPAPPRISSVQRDLESPASGIDTTPEVTVSGLRFGHTVKVLDGATEVASAVSGGATVTLNAEHADAELVVEGDGPHSLTAVAVDQNGAASPASPPFVYLLRPTETDAVPKVADLEPSSGPTSGGTVVSIRGSGLAARDVTVRFGDVEAVEVKVVSDTEVTAVAPGSAQRAVDVTVATAKGTSPVGPGGRYTYGAGSWSDGGEPSSCGSGCGPRSLHTATLLGDGSVLVAGGSPDFFVIRNEGGEAFTEALNSSQRYVGGKWRSAATLDQSRFLHTATLLDPASCRNGTAPAGYPCGSVLVAGGQTPLAVATPSAEVYDPASDDWRPTSGLGVARLSHTATLLHDGRVLVVGGVVTEPERGLTPLAAAEVYDPVTRTWAPVPPLLPARANHTATLMPDGRVLVAGGLSGYSGQGDEVYGATTTASAAIYDPRTNLWSPTAPLAVARFDHTATLLDGPACSRAPTLCGKVIVAGGDDGGPQYQASSELFDVASGTWSATSGLLDAARAGHTATMLANGTVLVAGGGPRFPAAPDPPKERAIRSAALFDPATSTWHSTSAMASRRGGHTATALADGRVLVAAGYEALLLEGISSTPTDTSELYRPAPDIRSVEPPVVPAGQESWIVVRGSDFGSVSKATLLRHSPGSGLPPLEVEHTVASNTLVRLRVPPVAPGVLTIALLNDGGTSSIRPAHPAHRLVVKGPPDTPAVKATPLSSSSVLLSFAAVDDGAGSAPATTYVVEQSVDGSGEPVRLCKGHCRFATSDVGAPLELRVDDLEPGTTYTYAVRAENDLGILGEPGTVSVATPPLGSGGCAADGPRPEGVVRYPGGRYSLIGLPRGTIVNSDSSLYQWLDAGAGGSYGVAPSTAPLEGGLGYWAWFSCPRLVPANPGEGSAAVPLGGYHASMVGNPSGTARALMKGHDFAARWDAETNSYKLSAYRQAQWLAVGEGIWVFSYLPTTVRIAAEP